MRNATVGFDTERVLFSSSSLCEPAVGGHLRGDEEDPVTGVSLRSQRPFQSRSAFLVRQRDVPRSQMIPRLLMVTFTAPIADHNVDYDVPESGAYALEWSSPPKRGRRVSWREACLLAQQILADTERAIEEDHLAEAQLLSFVWDSDELP